MILRPTTQEQSLQIEHPVATAERPVRDPGVVTFQQSKPTWPGRCIVALADDFDRWISPQPLDLAGLTVERHNDPRSIDREADGRRDPLA